MGKRLTTGKLLPTLRFRLRHTILNARGLSVPYMAIRPGYRDEGHIRRSTEIVLDGFPRSANSYARYAFHVATRNPSALAGHTHSSEFLRRAARRGIPAVSLYREPDAVVASLIQMEPGVKAKYAYVKYRKFYERLLGQPNILFTSFEQATGDFGAVIRNINDRFGTNFTEYSKTDESEQEVRSLVDASGSMFSGKLTETTVARPSASRASASELLVDLDRSTQRQRARAQRVYEDLNRIGLV